MFLKIVHERTIQVQQAINVVDENEFLTFWTHRFPLLIITMYDELTKHKIG